LLQVADLIIFVVDAEAVRVGPLELNDIMQCFIVFRATIIVLSTTVALDKQGVKTFFSTFFSQTSKLAQLELLLAVVLTPYFCICRLCGINGSALGALRNLRIVTMNEGLHLFLTNIAQMIPSMTQMAFFVFVVLYFFTAVAVDLFGRSVEALSTFPKAGSALGGMLIGVDSVSVINDAVSKTTIFHAAFFVAYYAIAVLVVLNLITALMLEFYDNKMTEAAEALQSSENANTVKLEKCVVASQKYSSFANTLGNVVLKEDNS